MKLAQAIRSGAAENTSAGTRIRVVTTTPSGHDPSQVVYNVYADGYTTSLPLYSSTNLVYVEDYLARDVSIRATPVFDPEAWQSI
jgi:hypothetical protein